MPVLKAQRKSSFSRQNSKVGNASKKGSGLVRLSFVEMQQAYDTEKQVYKSFAGHANILELLNVYELLKNSIVSPAIMSGWMWHSWRGEVGEKGYPEGEGRAYLGMNIYFIGSFKHGLLHGKGILKWEDYFGNVVSYEGTFFYNCLQESGEYNWNGRGAYTGKILDGFPNKAGVMQEGKRGHVYDGNFVYGLREGSGKMIYKDGEEIPNYMGDWVEDQKHGQGRYFYRFATYQGEWVCGKRGGLGIQTQMVDKKKASPLHVPIFAASVYEGTWLKGFPHGRGKHIWTWDHNKETLNLLHNAYVGDFEHGMRSNRGTFYYASGAIYQGFWKNNFKDGHGLYTYEDGRLIKVLCNIDRFHFHDDRSIVIHIKQALDSVMEEDVDIESLKLKLLYLTLRFTNAFRVAFHDYSAYTTHASKFNSIVEKKTFDATVQDIQSDNELAINDANDASEGAPLPPPLPPPDESVAPPEPTLDENGNPIPIVEEPKVDQSAILLKAALKKYRLSKSASANFSIKQDFIHEVSRSYLKFIVKYVRGGEKRDTLFGDALGGVDDNLYYIHKNIRLEGQAYAMTVDNFWRLCYDAHIVEPGLGLAQIDAIIYPSSNAWDDSFDYYCPKRQLIHREVIENLVKIGLCKYFGHGMQVDMKLQDFFEQCFVKIENKEEESIYKFLMEQPTQDVLLQYEPQFRILFAKFLLKCKTNFFFIRLEHIVRLFQDVIYEDNTSQENALPSDAPQALPIDVPPSDATQNIVPQNNPFQESILRIISQTLYQTEYPKNNPQLYLDLEINFKEFELLLVKFGVLRFSPYKQFGEENSNHMKEHAQIIQKFMDEISGLKPLPPPPIEEEELLDEELQDPES